MSNFKGIAPKALELLEINRFNDSKPFYEEHKEELKQGVTVPMRSIVDDLSETVLTIDEDIYYHPIYSVSRIRRDTRFTKDKTLYRDHMWILWRRNKKLYSNVPVLWFEVSPRGYDMGVGFYTNSPAQMSCFREHLEGNEKKFKRAVAKLEKLGFKFCGDPYKKKLYTCADAQLDEFYNSKSIAFMKSSSNIIDLTSPALVEQIKEFMLAAKDMYDFLLQVHVKLNEEV